MNTAECIKTRRSIRKYTDQKVSHELIREIVETASYSPSWKNTQISRFTFIENREIIDKIADEMVLDFEFNMKTLKAAPAIIIVSYVTKRSGFERDGSFSTPKGDGFEMYDAGIASQSLCLAAHEKGLGTVILGYFDEEKIAKFLELPENQKIAAVIPIGYPAKTPEAPARKSVDELLIIK